MSYHHQDDVIGFCGDMRHPYGCQDGYEPFVISYADAIRGCTGAIARVAQAADEAEYFAGVSVLKQGEQPWVR